MDTIMDNTIETNTLFSKPKKKSTKPPELSCISKLGGIYCSICDTVLGNRRNYDRHYLKHNTDSIVYTCAACFKDIPSYKSFRDHCYTQHVLKSKFECDVCKRSFSKATALNEHIKIFHLKMYVCPTPCNKVFNSPKELREHSVTHIIQSTYDCNLCDTQKLNIDSCKSHAEAHIEYQYNCPICNDDLTTKKLAAEHLKKHFKGQDINLDDYLVIEDLSTFGNPMQVLCAICNTNFKNKSEFESHYSGSHDGKIIYWCSICRKSFEVYDVFSNHNYNHFVKNRFKCDACDKTFSRLPLLVLHKETAHSESKEENKFKCVECHQTFCVGKSLKTHLMEVHGVPYQICPHPSCGKLFDSPDALVFHKIEHENNSDRRCVKCGMLFKNILSCFKHIDIHKKKRYPCPVCNRKYSEKYLLVKHLAQHYPTELHTCPECGKMYPLKSRLLEHLKIHQTKIHLECGVCKKTFPNNSRLQDHMNIHNGVTPYKCMICSKLFKAAPNIRKHLKKVHKILSATKDFLTAHCMNSENNNTDDVVDECKAREERIIEQCDPIVIDDCAIKLNNDKNNQLQFVKLNNDNNNQLHSVKLNNDNNNQLHSVKLNKNNQFQSVPDDVDESIPNDDPFDCDIDFEIINEILMDTDTSSQNTIISSTECQKINLPNEYGPDFIYNSTTDPSDYGTDVVNLAEAMLPHIDPSLTVTNNADTKQNLNLTQFNFDTKQNLNLTQFKFDAKQNVNFDNTVHVYQNIDTTEMIYPIHEQTVDPNEVEMEYLFEML